MIPSKKTLEAINDSIKNMPYDEIKINVRAGKLTLFFIFKGKVLFEWAEEMSPDQTLSIPKLNGNLGDILKGTM